MRLTLGRRLFALIIGLSCVHCHIDLSEEFPNVNPSHPDSLCRNGTKDAQETDVDCGGPCLPCAVDASCQAPEDCQTQKCEVNRCAPPACDDGIHNGDETDVDCGGTCEPCAQAAACRVAADCQSQRCEDALCSTCDDGRRSGDELDVDCRGPCEPCTDQQKCSINPDCISDTCEAGRCVSCRDNIKNVDETGIDCGGWCVFGCAFTALRLSNAKGQLPQVSINDARSVAIIAISGGRWGRAYQEDRSEIESFEIVPPSEIWGPAAGVYDTGYDLSEQTHLRLAMDPSAESFLSYYLAWHATLHYQGQYGGNSTDVCASFGGEGGRTNTVRAVSDAGGSPEEMNPAIARASGMVTMVAYQSDQGSNDENWDIRCRPASEYESGSFMANSATLGDQKAPALAMASTGSLVVVWEHHAESEVEIYGRLFTRETDTWVAANDEAIVNTMTAGSQQSPRVAMADDGSFVVVWSSQGQSPATEGNWGGPWDIRARFFDATGAPRGEDFIVNHWISSDSRQISPDVAIHRVNGDAVIVWAGNEPGDSQAPELATHHIFAREVAATGEMLTGQIQVNHNTADRTGQPSVAVSTSGDIVVSWNSEDAEGSTRALARSTFWD